MRDFRGVALVQRESKDVVLWEQGLADEMMAASCSVATRFQIASVSKQFTAAALLLLVDRGVLSVDDSISRWIEGSPSTWKLISLHHLLCHMSGLPHWNPIAPFDLTQRLEPADEVRMFQDLSLVAAPGSKFSYSSPGWVLLADVIERASDRPFAVFLQEEIFGPLGMDATFVGNGEMQQDLATGYVRGKRAPSFELDVVNRGTGSVWSTVHDMARWDAALSAGRILSQSSRRAMLTVHATTNGLLGPFERVGYGYGWFIGTAMGRRAIFHPGDNPGFLAFNAWFPDDEVRLIIMSNDECTDIYTAANELLTTVFSG